MSSLTQSVIAKASQWVNASFVVILPALLFFMFINTNSAEEQLQHMIIYVLLLAFSFVPFLRSTSGAVSDDTTLLYIWRGVCIIYILLTIWNYFFVEHIAETGYVRDIFRDRFWKYYAPIYGIPENYNFSDIALALTPIGVYLAVMYFFVKKNKTHVGYMIVISCLFYLIFILVFSLTESRARVMGNIYDYRYDYSGIFTDINSVQSLRAVLGSWVENLSFLHGRFSHYPPANYILLNIERTNFSAGGLLKSLVYLASIACIPLVYYLSVLITRKNHIAITAVMLFAVSPGMIIFPSTATSMITAFFTLAIYVLLMRSYLHKSYLCSVTAGLVLFVYSLFSFVFFVSLFTYVVTALFFSSLGYMDIKKLVSNIAIMLLVGIALHMILYVWSGFNIIECLYFSIHNNFSGLTTEPFDNLERYILRSSGNLLAYVGFSGAVLFALVMSGVFRGLERSAISRAFILSLVCSILLISFSTLFYMETERIWVFFTPLVCISAAVVLGERYMGNDKGGQGFAFMVILGLGLGSVTEEVIFLHYL